MARSNVLRYETLQLQEKQKSTTSQVATQQVETQQRMPQKSEKDYAWPWPSTLEKNGYEQEFGR